MNLFNRFNKPEQQKDAQQKDARMAMPVFCYRTAYFVLPQLLYSDAERLIGYFTSNSYPAGPYLYAMAAQILQVEPNREDALSFQAHTTELAAGVACFILEYPRPPAVDLAQDSSVLAPFFSAIVRDQAGSELSYYVLGQNPLSGTTLRTVLPDGLNANMGPGPSPELDAFVECLKQRTTD